jgi:hypothetical protein
MVEMHGSRRDFLLQNVSRTSASTDAATTTDARSSQAPASQHVLYRYRAALPALQI